jgi:hypothetical protein
LNTKLETTMTIDTLETTAQPLTHVTPIIEADYTWWADKLETLDWVYAVTYAEGAPHEYISEKTQEMTRADFVRAARVLHTFGEPQKFYKWTRIYLVHNGWKYWTMDSDHRDVNLINRGRADHVYGVQNAPRTLSATPTAYDPIATYWDAEYAATEEERDGWVELVDEVTGGHRKYRTLDIGAGTGLALDLNLTEAVRLTAVEPSHPMLNDMVRKHPLLARVEPMSFAEARARRLFGGTKFDLVLALGGSGSYLTREDWEAMPEHASGRYVLSVYAEGLAPATGDRSAAELASARDRLRVFANQRRGRVERIGRFDIAVVTL